MFPFLTSFRLSFLVILILCVSNIWSASNKTSRSESIQVDKRDFSILADAFATLFDLYYYDEEFSSFKKIIPLPPPPARSPPPPSPRSRPPLRRPPGPRTTTTTEMPKLKRALKPIRIPPLNKVPSYFDARDKWPHCPSIGEIWDQGICQSSWAFAITSMITDRICIISNGKNKIKLSAEDALTCCLGEDGCSRNDPCWGGHPEKLLFHYLDKGIVSTACKSYSFVTCINLSQKICPTGTFTERHSAEAVNFRSDRFVDCYFDYRKFNSTRPICAQGTQIAEAKVCMEKCDDKSKLDYKKDLHRAQKVYRLSLVIKEIMTEIITHGPIASNFKRYEDFWYYTGGIYQHRRGIYLGFYIVKIIGWGEEDGVLYWLGVNSQNEEWGENGFFRIIRGINDCEIERYLYAAIPKL